jgi:molybdopterin-guanine dinucleotide biosynthesis protein A
VLSALAETGRTAVATADGRLQPVLALYQPSALPALRAAEPGIPLTRAVETLDPARVPVPPAAVRNVNTPDELAAAEQELRRA